MTNRKFLSLDFDFGRKAYIAFKDVTMSYRFHLFVFSLIIPDFYMVDWILFKFSDRDRNREWLILDLKQLWKILS